MHAFFTPFGSYPNNAIVGGSGSIAPGAALFKRVNRKPGIIVCQHRGRLVRLRPRLGGADLRVDGSVQDALGPGAGRRPADPLQLHEQPVRHGGTAHGRDHGLPLHRPDRRRGQPRAAARGTRQRLRSARRHRRIPQEDRGPRGGQGPGPARHGDVPHQRAFALGRLQLPDKRGNREVAGGGFAPVVQGQAGAGARLPGKHAGRDTRGHRVRRLPDVPARHRSARRSADRRRFGPRRPRHVLQRHAGDVRRQEAGAAPGLVAERAGPADQGQGSGPRSSTASRCRR